MAATTVNQPGALPGTANTPLPPSIEKAYYRKCIELKRRMSEVELHNDAVRLRKVRLERAITKMRLERAILLERLQEQMDLMGNGSDDEETPPPELQERPIRHKRLRATPPVESPRKAHSRPLDEQARMYGARSFDSSHYANVPVQSHQHHNAPYPQYDTVVNAYILPSQHQHAAYEPRRSEDGGVSGARKGQEPEATPNTGGFTAVNR